MFSSSKTCFVWALTLAIRTLLIVAVPIIEECGDVQHNVENGMIRLPDFSGENIRDLNCSWTYTAPPDRKLLVKVDNVHLPPLDLRMTQLQLFIDDTFYDIPRNCVQCLREMIGGKVLKIVFTSEVVQTTESPTENPNEAACSDGIGSFQIRYKAFDPLHCGKPEQIESGVAISEGRKLGQTIFYHCNPPYDLIGESEAVCQIGIDSPVPEWSSKPPTCTIEECTGKSVLKRGSSGAIASPGYPSFLHHFSMPCLWEIVAQASQQIKVSISYLKFPKYAHQENVSRLSLVDGDSNYIVNVTETLTNGSLNFTTLTNKLTVELVIYEENAVNEELGFYMDYSVISSSCPKPKPPKNGEVIAYSNDLGSTVAYRCSQGYVLVGELHAECLLNGKWSHPTPSCELLNNNLPPLISASNDSDTVTAGLSEIITPESFKSSKNAKKKANDLFSFKESLNSSDKSTVPKDKKFLETIHFHNETVKKQEKAPGKKSDKDGSNGPKSEPHLFQVVPPKDVKKTSTHDPSVIMTSSQATNVLEPVPTLDAGYVQQIDIWGLKLSLTMLYVIAGVGIPLVVGIIILVAIIIYRRKYPVRMRFGRKFSTFENPMYVTKDAQHPRELKRLTT